jgi:hypothetical protein
MARKTYVTEKPVVLEGFQSVLKLSQFGKYELAALIDDSIVQELETERAECLNWAESKLKNPKRASLKAEPWEEVAEARYKVKFNWLEATKPTIVDSEGTVITSTNLPIYSGSTVKLAFYQKPYILKDNVTYGTKLVLQGLQIISLSSKAGVDAGDMNAEDVAELFGKTKGFKADDPNVTPAPSTEQDDNDF